MLLLASPASASLSCAVAGGEAVGEVAAGEMLAARRTLPVGADLVEVALPRVARALGDALGDLADP